MDLIMKKIISLLLVVMMVMGCATVFSSCGDPGKTLAEVKEAGELVVATSPDFPPFENLEGTEIVGIEVEIMEAVCEELGVTLKLQDMAFESVLTAVAAGKCDVGMSGISVTADRQKNMLFTDAYCMAQQAIVVTVDSTIASKADLTGKKISVQTATTAEEYCLGEGYAVSSFETNNDAAAALTGGRVDAWVIDDLTAAEMVEELNKDGEVVKILDEAMTEEPYAFAFAFGSEDLVAEINKILAKMQEDGTIEALFEEYGAPYAAPKK